MRQTIGAIVVATAVSLVGGCTDPKTGQSINEERKAALEELGQMLKSLAEEGKKPPARPADLASVEAMLATAGLAIRTGEIVYLWGNGYVAGSAQVVAYEKSAGTDGGYVLLQDGSVKHMSASELQLAPKAK